MAGGSTGRKPRIGDNVIRMVGGECQGNRDTHERLGDSAEITVRVYRRIPTAWREMSPFNSLHVPFSEAATRPLNSHFVILRRSKSKC